jgi:hypothetical protein
MTRFSNAIVLNCPLCKQQVVYHNKPHDFKPESHDWCGDCCCAVIYLVSEEATDLDVAMVFKQSFSSATKRLIVDEVINHKIIKGLV